MKNILISFFFFENLMKMPTLPTRPYRGSYIAIVEPTEASLTLHYPYTALHYPTLPYRGSYITSISLSIHSNVTYPPSAKKNMTLDRRGLDIKIQYFTLIHRRCFLVYLNRVYKGVDILLVSSFILLDDKFDSVEVSFNKFDG